MIYYAPLPEVEHEQEDEISSSSSKKNIFQFPNLILGVIALFFYVGAEVIAGDTIIRYGITLGIPINTAKVFTSLTLASMIGGYIIGIILIPKYLSQQKPFVSVTLIALLGFANALVWPAIWPLALHGLKNHIKTGSAMLIMAISGGAILPLAWGKLADVYNAQSAYWVMIPLYIFILFYAIKGHKFTSWK